MERIYHGIKENASPNTHNVVATILLQESKLTTILDIPCGEGAFTKRLLDKGLEVYSADCVKLINVPAAKFSICDMNGQLPYADKSFDAVVCIDGIAHAEAPFQFIRECRRLVRDKGFLIISTPNISALRSRWRWFLTGFHNKSKTPLNEKNVSPQHIINLLAFHELRYMLHTNGFRIVSIHTNRVKWISWLYLSVVPLSYLITCGVLHREEKDPSQRVRNRAIRAQLFSRAVLFGESLIVKARRMAHESHE